MLWGARRGNGTIVAASKRWSAPMSQLNDLSRSLVALEQDATLIAVIEMGQSSWLVAGVVPGIERNPLKKLSPDRDRLLQLLHRWRKEAVQAGRTIKRIAVAYEAGRDGFWLVARFSQIEGYRCLSLMRAVEVVKCQLAVRCRAFRSCSQAAISSIRVCLSGMRRSRHWDDRTASSDSARSSQLPCFGV